MSFLSFLDADFMDIPVKLILVLSLFSLFLVSIVIILAGIKDELLQIKGIFLWLFAVSVINIFLTVSQAPHLWYLLIVGFLIGALVSVPLVTKVKASWELTGIFVSELEKTAEQKEFLKKEKKQIGKVVLIVVILYPIIAEALRFFVEDVLNMPNIKWGFAILFTGSTIYLILVFLRLFFSVRRD